MDIKDRIKLIMDKTEMTQQDFANKLGISPASLSHVFQGRTNPTINHVTAIYNAFPSISSEWLMFGNGEMYKSATTTANFENVEETAIEIEDDMESIEPAFLPPNATPSIPIDSSNNRQNGSHTMGSLFANAEPMAEPKGQFRTPSQPVQTATSKEVELMQAILQLKQELQKKNEEKTKRIKEIRVFYDDGTFEIFVSPTKWGAEERRF